jgi:hypothetical protein
MLAALAMKKNMAGGSLSPRFTVGLALPGIILPVDPAFICVKQNIGCES